MPSSLSGGLVPLNDSKGNGSSGGGGLSSGLVPIGSKSTSKMDSMMSMFSDDDDDDDSWNAGFQPSTGTKNNVVDSYDPYEDWDDDDDKKEMTTYDYLNKTRSTSVAADNLAQLDDIFANDTLASTSSRVKTAPAVSYRSKLSNNNSNANESGDDDESINSWDAEEEEVKSPEVEEDNRVPTTRISSSPPLSPKFTRPSTPTSPVATSPPKTPVKEPVVAKAKNENIVQTPVKEPPVPNISSTKKPQSAELEESWGDEEDLLDSLMPDDRDEKSTKPAGQSVSTEQEEVKQDSPPPPAESEKDSIGGYEFSFGRNSRPSTGPRRRRPGIASSKPKPNPAKELWFSDSDDDGPLFKNRPRSKFLSSPADDGKPLPTREISPAPESAEQGPSKEKQESRSKVDRNVVESKVRFDEETTPVADKAPLRRVKTPFASDPIPRAQQQQQQQQQPVRLDPPQVSIDVSKLTKDLKKEYDQLLEAEKSNFQARIAETEEKLSSERKAIVDENTALKAKLEEVESKLEQEKSEKEQLKNQLQGAQQTHERSMTVLKAAHSEAVQSLKEDIQVSKLIASVAGKVQASSESLYELEKQVSTRFESSELARVSQLECRERLVAEMEEKVRLELERSTEESKKLQALLAAAEVSQHTLVQKLEEDRGRLQQEQSRLEAFQLTMKMEAESMRNDTASEKTKLRAEKALFETERREFLNRVTEKEREIAEASRTLAQQKEAFASENRTAGLESEKLKAQLRIEEQQLREVREAQARQSAVFQEERLKIQQEIVKLKELENENRFQKEHLQEEKNRIQSMLKQLDTAEKDKREALKLAENVSMAQHSIRKEQGVLEESRRVLLNQQCMFTNLRLKVAKERSQVYKYKAAASREGHKARALQRKMYSLDTIGQVDENKYDRDRFLDQIFKHIT